MMCVWVKNTSLECNYFSEQAKVVGHILEVYSDRFGEDWYYEIDGRDYFGRFVSIEKAKEFAENVLQEIMNA